jgi:hypothetical protein
MNRSQMIVFLDIFGGLILSGTISMEIPMPIVYADDSSGQSQTDQSQHKPLLNQGTKECMGTKMAEGLVGGGAVGGPGGAFVGGLVAGAYCAWQNR